MRALHATRVVFLACVCSGIITHDAVVGQPNLLSQPEIAGIDDAPTVDEILAVMNKGAIAVMTCNQAILCMRGNICT